MAEKTKENTKNTKNRERAVFFFSGGREEKRWSGIRQKDRTSSRDI